ncbi:hypothetical protein ABZ769_08095 [Streptomyces olivoreticuli]
MATRKRAAAAKPKVCPDCKGRDVADTVRVGRERRDVGQQMGLCRTCLGTGFDPGKN